VPLSARWRASRVGRRGARAERWGMDRSNVSFKLEPRKLASRPGLRVPDARNHRAGGCPGGGEFEHAPKHGLNRVPSRVRGPPFHGDTAQPLSASDPRTMGPGASDPLPAGDAVPDSSRSVGRTEQPGDRASSRDQSADGGMLEVPVPCARTRWNPERCSADRRGEKSLGIEDTRDSREDGPGPPSRRRTLVLEIACSGRGGQPFDRPSPVATPPNPLSEDTTSDARGRPPVPPSGARGSRRLREPARTSGRGRRLSAPAGHDGGPGRAAGAERRLSGPDRPRFLRARTGRTRPAARATRG